MAAPAASASPARRLRVHLGPTLHSTGRCVSVDVAWDRAAPAMPSAAWRQAVAGHPAIRAAGLEAAVDAALADAGEDAVVRLAVLLQRALGHDVPDPPAAPRPPRLLVPIWDPTIGGLAAAAAVGLVALARGGRADAAAEAAARLDRYFDGARRVNHTESMRRLIACADSRRIPWARLIPASSIIRFGDGVRQVRIDGGSFSSTGLVADRLSMRKHLANALMRQHGLPVPRCRLVRSADDALRAARDIGFPVAVKPDATNYGTAVSTGIADEAGLRKAYAAAAAHGAVLVEQHIAGDHARLLVFQGRFLSSVQQDPAQVVGDGRRSVAALIAAVNAGRTATLSSQFQRIAIDEEAHDLLAQQRLTIDSIPAEGRRVRLRHGSNTSRGGTARNVTAQVHPDNARLAERATAVLGLDIAGVDLITPDIERSFRAVGGMICEINAGPGLYMREPGYLIEEAIFDGLHPGARPGRVPIVVVLGDGELGEVRADAVASALERRGVGGIALVTPARLEIGRWRHVAPTRGLDAAATAALGDPETRAAVILLSPATILEVGLPFDRSDLAVVPAAPSPGGAAGWRPAADLLRAHADAVVDPDGTEFASAIERIAALAPVRRP